MNKLIFIIATLVALITLIPTNATSTTHLTSDQLLSIAFQEGDQIGLGSIVRAILLQETNAGTMGRIHDNNTSFGVMCVKVGAARDATNTTKSYAVIRQKLISDDVYNIYVAVRYLEYLLKVFDGDVNKAVLAYNVGLGRVKKHGITFDPNNYLARVNLNAVTSSTIDRVCYKTTLIR